MKPTPVSRMQVVIASGGRSILDAQRRQHVRRAGLRGEAAIAVLGDRYAAAGDHEGGGGRYVDAVRIVAAGADDVDRALRRLHPQHLFAHGRDGARNLGNLFAAHSERHEKGADLAWRCLAGHDDAESVLRLFEGEDGPGRYFGEKRSQIAHWSECQGAVDRGLIHAHLMFTFEPRHQLAEHVFGKA